MENLFLGEEIVTSEFEKYTPTDWSLFFIEKYRQSDENHHSLWLIDQVARILKGTKVIVKLAKWSNGESEYRFSSDKPSKEYLDFIKELKTGENGEETYLYDEGIAP